MKNGKSGFLPVNGVRLFYRELGRGRPLLLLHGWGQSHLIFKGVARHLARRYRVILLDSRGHGASGAGGDGITIPRMAADAVGVLDYLGIDKAVVLGFSDGGNIALQMAADFPFRLSAAVAISANAWPKGLAPSFLRKIRSLYRILIAAEVLGFPVERQRQLTNLILRWPRLSDERLRAIRVPVLLLAARHDIVRPAHTRHLRRVIPHARGFTVPQSSHHTIVKRWRSYIAAVEVFTDGH